MIEIERTLIDAIRESIAHYYRDILGLPDWKVRADKRVLRGFDINSIKRFEAAAGPLADQRLLDLGCGWGGVLYEMESKRPHSLIGIDPDVERIAYARKIAQPSTAVVCAIGEQLPLPSNYFDRIGSYEVLEHTLDPEQVVLEMMRVLRSGGIAHIRTPNYMAFWEPHYKIRWLPLLPKAIGRIYLKLRGRDPSFIGHIQYVNRRSMPALFRRHGIRYDDLSVKHPIKKFEHMFGRLLPSAVIRQLASFYALFVHRDQEYLIFKD